MLFINGKAELTMTEREKIAASMNVPGTKRDGTMNQRETGIQWMANPEENG